MANLPSAAAKNAMLDGLGAVALYASVHTGDPGSSGANEASGGSPAYARQSVSWLSASAGSMSSTSLTFDVPAGTYSWLGLWSASTGGTYYYKIQFPTSQVYGSQGTLPIAFVTIDQSLVATA